MILIDTGPLVALCDARDALHSTAVTHLATLARAEFATCDAVLTEAAFHLPHLHQRQRMKALIDAIDVQPLPLAHERAFWVEVFDWLEDYAEHEPDWADGCLAVLSGHDRRTKVWTYDREFKSTWRRPNGTAIPMAVR